MNLYLDKENSPHIVVNVFSSKYTAIDCYIDTGFSGGLSLPKKYKHLFKGSRPISFLDYRLGDGSLKTFEIYNIKIKFIDKEKIISAFFTDGKDALVGIEFLTGFKFTLDLKKFTINLD